MVVSRNVATHPAAQRVEPAPKSTPVDLERLRSSARVHAWCAIGGWWICSRALVVGTAAFVQYVQWPAGAWRPALAHRPLALLTAWDGRWYRMVAERGYLVIPRHQSDTAFFPLYPSLLRVGRAFGLSADAAGLLVANLALLVALVALYELVRTWT